jgi:hypothetical protein
VAASPVCESEEVPVLDKTVQCCPSCRRVERTCDVASVAKCYAALAECATGEEPTVVSGTCCGSCRRKRPVCEGGCGEKQICIGIKSVSEAGVVTYTPTCKSRVDIIFSLATASASGLAEVFSLLSASQLRHVVAEYVKRYCDKPDNYDNCEKFVDALRDLVITVTIDCGASGSATGGDARADGKDGAVDATTTTTDRTTNGGASHGFRNFEGEDVRAITGCAVRVLVSVANDATTTGSTGSVFRLWANDATASSVVSSAVTTDSEAQEDGLTASATYDTSTYSSTAASTNPNAAIATIVAAAFAVLL